MDKLILGLGLKFIYKEHFMLNSIENIISGATKKLNRAMKLAYIFESDDTTRIDDCMPCLSKVSLWLSLQGILDKNIDEYTNNVRNT